MSLGNGGLRDRGDVEDLVRLIEFCGDESCRSRCFGIADSIPLMGKLLYDTAILREVNVCGNGSDLRNGTNAQRTKYIIRGEVKSETEKLGKSQVSRHSCDRSKSVQG